MLKFVALPWAIHVAWTLSTAKGAGRADGVEPPPMHIRCVPTHVFAHAWFNTFFSEHDYHWRRCCRVLGWLDVPLSPWRIQPAVALLASLWTNQDSRHKAALDPPFALALAQVAAMIALPLFIYGASGRLFQACRSYFIAPCICPGLVFVPLVAIVRALQCRPSSSLSLPSTSTRSTCCQGLSRRR